MRSIIVKILHSVEGGDVEQWLKPRNISVFVSAHSLSLLTLLSLYLRTNIAYSFASISYVVIGIC